MKITLIGCPFRTSYGGYISSLRSALERTTGSPVQWVASNCGCGDPIEVARRFQVQNCDYFEMRTGIGGWNIVGYSPDPVKRGLKSGIRFASNYLRASRYARRASEADVIHFQQTLNAYGSDVAFHFLRRRSDAARVITLHELDPEQTDFPGCNQTYNLADAVIVHDSAMKEKLVSEGVAADVVNVVRCGTDLAEGENVARDGIVFYGGHHLTKNKGLGVLLKAYRCLKDRSQAVPRLRIHGHYGVTPPPDAIEMAKQAGVADDVEWLNDLPDGSSPTEEMARLYRRSQVCVLPFTGSFAGLAVGVAAANRLPIIATRLAGIPDHIGELGIWISGNDPVELANRIEQILSDEAMRRDYGTRLRAYAEQHLGWDVVARETLKIYESAARARRNGFVAEHKMKEDAARRIVITGVSRGLGRALVDGFAARGDVVCGCARSAGAVAELSRQYPPPHDFAVVDVSSDAEVRAWAERVLAGGPPDLLINNAGLINRNAPLWKVPEEELSRLVDVNIKGVANVLRHFVPAMVERGRGVIVNLSSGCGRGVLPELAPYCATKWAIEGLTRALAQELPAGMAAVPLNPGIINTDMLQTCWGNGAQNYPDASDWARRAVPLLLRLGPKHNGRPLSVPSAVTLRSKLWNRLAAAFRGFS